ncbi:alpha-L-fucosidase [Niabella sp. W65]|nr:alpha-L-fucosidase [Niabella sp. W65]MCH7363045.1 alpha-L-fucosidase [Niabella sp. W65]
MKYAVLTTKHHEGFCLFDSKYTDYKSTNTAAKRDLVKEFVEAFRAEGLKVGFYYSLIDWHHPDFTIDRLHPKEK